jgi:hypothetical protein
MMKIYHRLTSNKRRKKATREEAEYLFPLFALFRRTSQQSEVSGERGIEESAEMKFCGSLKDSNRRRSFTAVKVQTFKPKSSIQAWFDKLIDHGMKI